MTNKYNIAVKSVARDTPPEKTRSASTPTIITSIAIIVALIQLKPFFGIVDNSSIGGIVSGLSRYLWIPSLCPAPTTATILPSGNRSTRFLAMKISLSSSRTDATLGAIFLNSATSCVTTSSSVTVSISISFVPNPSVAPRSETNIFSFS